MSKYGSNRILAFVSPLIILAFLSISMRGNSQSVYVYMELKTWKYGDNSRALIANLIAEDDEGERAAGGLTVQFSMLENEEWVDLPTAVSDPDGNAIVEFEPAYVFPKDEEGYINVMAVYEGDDQYDATEAELTFKDVEIEFSFVEEDEEKLIWFEGKIFGPDGETGPLPDDDIYFYVPRMFSDLKIADGWFEEDGTGYVDFPTDIIGDSVGNILVIARIEDHYDYGNVEKSVATNWATPKLSAQQEGPIRELWTPIAPLWMIITLIIMLAGVWGHYIYAMYELYMIRKLGKKEDKIKADQN